MCAVPFSHHSPHSLPWQLLRKSFVPLDNEFQFAISSDAADVEAIQEFLMESIKGNCEVLVLVRATAHFCFACFHFVAASSRRVGGLRSHAWRCVVGFDGEDS